jgi:hypothetical protein
VEIIGRPYTTKREQGARRTRLAPLSIPWLRHPPHCATASWRDVRYRRSGEAGAPTSSSPATTGAAGVRPSTRSGWSTRRRPRRCAAWRLMPWHATQRSPRSRIRTAGGSSIRRVIVIRLTGHERAVTDCSPSSGARPAVSSTVRGRKSASIQKQCCRRPGPIWPQSPSKHKAQSIRPP